MFCIYHKGCMDGFGSAWVINKKYPNWGIKYIPVLYGDDPPDVTGRQVYIVDFSYSRDALIEMDKQAKSLYVIDHHKTAQENLVGLDFCTFDMNKSGAILTWEHFFPDQSSPIFLDYIQDRDLWKFELDHSKEINAAMYSYRMEFKTWDKFESIASLCALQDEGIAILRDRQKLIDSLVSGWAITRFHIEGHNVPLLNCPHWLASEVLNTLAQNEPFAMSYSDSSDTRTFQLRSSENGIDVSEVAKQNGGGGHKHAAGFSCKKPRIL